MSAILEANLFETRIAWAAGLMPDPILTVSQWSDSHRILPQKASAEPGPYRTSRTPYGREIMDVLSVTSPIERIVLMKGAQLGGTEFANNFLGYIIHHAPGPVMMVLPTDLLAKRSSKQRIAPMIEDTPELLARVRPARMRDSGNTLLAKEFPGGILIMTGANSAVGLRSMPARYLILDELDAYPFDISDEGDPVELAIKRTNTFGRKRKILMISTPKITGSSRIEAAYDESDRCQFLVPCPLCDHRAPIVFRNLRQAGGQRWSRDRPPTEVVLYCESCAGEIQEHQKTELLNGGHWEPTAQGDGKTRGFHLPAYYSPVGWYSWKDAAIDFLDAKRKGREHLKTWTNTVDGATFEEQAKRFDWGLIHELRHPPADDPVPLEVLILVAGVDIQHNRAEIGVWGLTETDDFHAIDHRIIPGDPGRDALWDDIEENLLELRYRHESGLDLEITATAIDSGYETQKVYLFGSRMERNHRIYVVKGFSGEGRPAIMPPNRKQIDTTGDHVNLFSIGVDPLKVWIYNRLEALKRGESEASIHIPAREPFDKEWVRQLTAEERTTRYVNGFERREWRLKKGEKRNEVLDDAVYARAASLILNPIWNLVVDNFESRLQDDDQPAAPKPRRRKRRRWATDY